MTEAIVPFPENPNNGSGETSTIQCHLCLHDIEHSSSDELNNKRGYVICGNCDYRQPLTKFPRPKDMAIFGLTISVVYIATIIAVLVSR